MPARFGAEDAVVKVAERYCTQDDPPRPPDQARLNGLRDARLRLAREMLGPLTNVERA